MGLFSGWFSKKNKDDGSFTDWRREDRRPITTAWPPVEARFSDSRGQVLNMSDAGFCLAMDENHAPERALVTIVQGDEILSRGFAMRVWRGGSRVGYHFAEGLTVERIQERRSIEAASRPAPNVPTQSSARAAILSAAQKVQEAEQEAEAALEALESRLQDEDVKELALSFPDEDALSAIQQKKEQTPKQSNAPIFKAPTPRGAAPSALRDRLKL